MSLKTIFLKTWLLTFCLLGVYSVAQAQNLTLDQVISLRSKSLGEVEEFLTGRSWQMLEATAPSENKKGIITFAYGKSTYDDKANSFIDYYYSESGENRLKVQVNKLALYNTYIARLKVLGYKLNSSKDEEGVIIKVYEGKSTVIRVSSSSQSSDFGSKTIYTFSILNSFDYAMNFDKN